MEALGSADYALAAAAVRAAMESPGPEITDALVAELPKAPADRQGLLILALADRGDPRVLPAVLQAAQSGDGQLRDPRVPRLETRRRRFVCPRVARSGRRGQCRSLAKPRWNRSKACKTSSVDDQVAARLTEAEGQMQLVLIDLAGRRRTAAAAPALWQAADDADPAVRTAALAGLGAVIETADLPKLIARLAETKDEREAAALDKALRDVCLRCGRSGGRRRAACRRAARGRRTGEGPDSGDAERRRRSHALETVAAAARSSDQELRDAAYPRAGIVEVGRRRARSCWNCTTRSATDRLKIRAIRAYIRIARQFDMPAERRAAMCRTALETAERDADKRLVLEVLLRYPSEQMQAIALEAAKVPALKDQALLVVMGMASKDINRAELGKALAQAGQTPVELEIVKAEYGAGEKIKDVTETLRKYAKDYRIIFLPSASYNSSFGGDPAQGIVKQLKIKYRINGKDGEVSLSENATIVLPMPK